jgi:hypothetical protein
VRTLEEVRGRCRIEPGDKPGQEHWIWAGCYDRKPKNGVIYETPVIRAPDYGRDPTGQKTYVQYGPRAVYNIEHGKAPPTGMRAYSTCQVHGCISPHCVRAMRPKSWGKLVAADGRFKGEHWTPHHIQLWDKRGRKVGDDKVRDILASPKTAQELAAETGLHETTIYRYRDGTLRSRVGMGVFAGLMR